MKQTDLEKLLADMSLKEKVDQMLQLSGAFYLGDENSVLTGPPYSSYSNPILYEKGFGYVFCLQKVLRKDYSER